MCLALLAWLVAACERDDALAPATVIEPHAEAPLRPKRIVLFSMDTVRADRVTGYGPNGVTPHVAEIAAQGVLFRDFYSASSYTLPATMSMITGLDVREHTLWSQTAVIDDRVTTLAQLLRRAGYRTQGFHEAGYVAAEYGFDRGFDEYVSREQRAVVGTSLWGILDWIRGAQAPYFLFLQTYAAHDPYGGFVEYRRDHPERGLPSEAELAQWRKEFPSGGPPEGLDPEKRQLCSLINQLVSDHERRVRCGHIGLSRNFVNTPYFEADRAALLRGYDERVRTIDRAIGRIRDLLVELGQWNDTLFIITSDHGEAFFEHELSRHQYVPFDEVLKASLIVSWPAGLGTEGRVVRGLTWHLDIVPTLLGLVGSASPRRRGMDLAPMLRAESAIPGDRAIFPAVLRAPGFDRGPLKRVALQAGLKYIEGDEHFGDAEGFLFDIASSPAEDQNLRLERPELFEQLRDGVDAYEQTLEPLPAIRQNDGSPLVGLPGELIPRLEISADQEARLRALGYR